MNTERPKMTRREVLKGAIAAAVGAEAVGSQKAESAESGQKLKEMADKNLTDLKERSADLTKRFEWFKNLGNEKLKKSVSKTVLPEFKRRIGEARGIAEACLTVWLFGFKDDAYKEEVENAWRPLGAIEKEIDAFMAQEL